MTEMSGCSIPSELSRIIAHNTGNPKRMKQDGIQYAITQIQDLIDRGVSAGKLVGQLAGIVGGGGGGRPNIAQAGGKDASKLSEALRAVPGFVKDALASSK